ncbi:hypothetical protein STEG23_037125 [Scotinomys teguina]
MRKALHLISSMKENQALSLNLELMSTTEDHWNGKVANNPDYGKDLLGIATSQDCGHLKEKRRPDNCEMV